MGASSQTGLLQESANSVFRTIFLALVLVSPIFFNGLNSSFSTVALPQINLSINDASWFASVAIYASPISTIIVGFIIDRFGRKTALIYSLLPSVIGWSLLLWNPNVFVLLLGQIFNGFTMGAGAYPVQVYAGECIMANNVRWRNIFMAWISVSSSLGTTCMLIMANFFDLSQICAISLTLCVCLLAIFHTVIPESPTWLYRKGRRGDAELAQKKLAIGQPILHTAECSTVHHTPTEAAYGSRLVRQFRILVRPDVYKPLLILSIAAFTMSFCGTSTVVSYMVNIIDNTIPGIESNETTVALFASNATNVTAENTELLKSYQYSLISGASMCVGSFVSIFILPRMGMKNMFIASKICIIFGLMTLTFSTVIEAAHHAFLRTAAVSLLSFLSGLELGPRISFAGDVFPVDAKGFASAPSLTGSIASATANKIFPYLRLMFGGYAYLFYAVASVFGIFYIYFFLPEVVGRTLDEINKEFKEDDK